MFKFGFDRATLQQLVQTVGDQADEFKADMSGVPLIYLSGVCSKKTTASCSMYYEPIP